MAHPIEKRISEREDLICRIDGQIADLSAERARIKAELDAYRDALQFVVPKSEKGRAVPRSSRRRGGVGDSWKRIISVVSGDGARGFSTDDIMAYADLVSIDLQRATARAQCANFVKAGLLDRVSDGHFEVTASGVEAFKWRGDEEEKTAGESLGQATPAVSTPLGHNGG